MEAAVSPLPDDADALKALLIKALQKVDQAEQHAAAVEAELANARALASATEAMIAHLKLQNAKLRREQYGASAERTERLLAQYELVLEDLEADAAEDELAAQAAAAKTTTIPAFERKKPVRKPFPDHLPRERVVVSAPCSCPACGSDRLSKLGEDVTETLEVIPRSWKVIQTVREKFACRDCEKITQPPAPFHVTPRGWAGPSFLAMLLFDKYGQHQPLHRQAEPLCQRRRATQRVDARRPDRCRLSGAHADLPVDRGPHAGRRAAARRRHHRADHGKGQDPYRPIVGLRARRSALRRQ